MFPRNDYLAYDVFVLIPCFFPLLLQIKKFKDALAKHGTDRCSLGLAKGLEESELQALAGNKDLSFTYTRMPVHIPSPDDTAEAVPASPKTPLAQPSRASQESESKTLVRAGR